MPARKGMRSLDWLSIGMLIGAAGLLAGSGAIHAQTAEAPAAQNPHAGHGTTARASGGHMAGVPVAAAADVASPEAIVSAYYRALSAPKGKKRDWNRYLALFFPGARLLPAEGKGHSGMMPRAFTPQTYLFNTEPNMVEAGFFQREVARRTERFGKILQVFSTYEVRHAESDATPFARGVSSFQLMFDSRRWWIFSVMWQPETSTLPVPKELLP
jgi:hypothetical protein